MTFSPNNAANVSVGKPKVGGAIFVAPLGTAIPTDATTALNEAFENLGFASDAGVVKSASISAESVNAWGGTEVLNSQTAYSETYAFTLIESQRIEALKVAYGEANVTGTLETGITVNHNAAARKGFVCVIEILRSNDSIQRIVIPNGKVKELGDVSFVDGSPIPYSVTIAALPDDNENSSIEYMAKVAD